MFKSISELIECWDMIQEFDAQTCKNFLEDTATEETDELTMVRSFVQQRLKRLGS